MTVRVGAASLPRTAKTQHVFFNLAPFPYSLVVVVLDEAASDLPPDTLRQMFETRSLELLLAVRITGRTSLDSAAVEWLTPLNGNDTGTLCFCLDDWPRVLKDLPPDTKIENLYASRIAGERHVRHDGHDHSGDGPPGYTVRGVARTTNEVWKIAEDVLGSGDFLRLRNRVLDIVDERIPPFPVIRHMGGSGFASRTDLVAYQGRFAVCKTFRKTAQQRYEAELEGLKLGLRSQSVSQSWIFGFQA